ncbi:MAG: hypothetical protein ACRELG_03015, partial [Gemmataceae bacterium]
MERRFPDNNSRPFASPWHLVLEDFLVWGGRCSRRPFDLDGVACSWLISLLGEKRREGRTPLLP